MLQKFLEFVLVPLIRALLHLFFRNIEVIGAERVPADAPVVYTANHFNSLLDGMLARAFLPRDPRPLAKATLWEITPFRLLLAATRAIPVYRLQDSQDPAYAQQNRDMFSACYEALARRECIVLFPEGQSHSEPALLPLKSGAARIVLGAEQQAGPLGVRIIPVGLNFDAKEKFRSRVLIDIGTPLDPMEGTERADPEDREAVGRLTGRVEEGIRSVTLNYPTWEEGNVIRRAADLYVSQHKRHAAEERFSDEISVHRRLAAAYPVMKEQRPRRVARLVEAVNGYDRLLRVLSIQHEHVIQEHPRLLQVIFSLRKFSLFLFRLPLALLGIFLNAIPYFLTRAVSRIRVRPDRASTTKLVAGFIIYPFCWTVQAALLGKGLFPPALWWLLAPVSGVASVLFQERHAQLLDELRTYLRLRSHSEMKAELRQRLETVEMEVTEFLELAKRWEPSAPAQAQRS
jgi:glycerol-3-phosphate O-acyltransferase/dihydroxyacetone phosphate acyltransferase